MDKPHAKEQQMWMFRKRLLGKSIINLLKLILNKIILNLGSKCNRKRQNNLK